MMYMKCQSGLMSESLAWTDLALMFKEPRSDGSSYGRCATVLYSTKFTVFLLGTQSKGWMPVFILFFQIAKGKKP